VDTPIVVALNAKAMLTLPLLSDIVIAERHVEFNDKHVLSGVPTATGSFLWPMSIGLVRSKRYLLTGDSFSAEEAERFGLVAEVVDTGASKTRATELAEAIAELDPTGVQMTKRALNEWVRVSWGPIFKHGMGLEFLHFPDRS
jgi:enoyl-CoA hydratase/carnithine racemase